MTWSANSATVTLSRKSCKYGYLFVAPAELNFSDEHDRIRKWQWRHFVLFDDGELTYSLDENPFTLPQERIDLRKCSIVQSSDDYTGHSNSLEIQLNNSKQYFIKSTSKDDIRRWQQLLIQYSSKSASSTLKSSSGRHLTSVLLTQYQPSDPSLLPSNQENQQEKIILYPSKTVQNSTIESNRIRDASVIRLRRKLNELSSEYADETKKREQYLNNINKFISTTTTQPRTCLDLTNSHSNERKTKQQIHKERKLNTERSKSLPRVSLAEDNPEQSSTKENMNNYNKQNDEKIHSINGTVIRKGWLSKLEKNQKDWRRYWFILTEESLFYYQDENVDENQTSAGKFDLIYCNSVEELPTTDNNAFVINTSYEQIQLVAVTSGIRKNWIDSLVQCIKQVRLTISIRSKEILTRKFDTLRSHLEHIKNDYHYLMEKKNQMAVNKSDDQIKHDKVSENNKTIRSVIFYPENSSLTDDLVPSKDILPIATIMTNSQKISPTKVLKHSTHYDRDNHHAVISTDLVKVVHSKQEMISQLEQKLMETEQKYQNLMIQFKQNNLQLKYDNERKENLILRDKLVKLEDKLFDSDRRSQILNELKLEVDQMQQVFDNLEKENNQLNDQLSTLKDNCSILEEDYKTAQMKLSLANKQIEQLEKLLDSPVEKKTIAEYKNKSGKINSTMTMSKKKEEILLSCLDDDTNIIEKLREDLLLADLDNSELNKENRDLYFQLKQALEQIQQLKSTKISNSLYRSHSQIVSFPYQLSNSDPLLTRHDQYDRLINIFRSIRTILIDEYTRLVNFINLFKEHKDYLKDLGQVHIDHVHLKQYLNLNSEKINERVNHLVIEHIYMCAANSRSFLKKYSHLFEQLNQIEFEPSLNEQLDQTLNMYSIINNPLLTKMKNIFDQKSLSSYMDDEKLRILEKLNEIWNQYELNARVNLNNIIQT
ncbi:unnamed protein product, partial [Didymodactylos carnosus]